MNKDEIKISLLGTLELALFMKIGIERFPVTKKAALTTFLVPFFLLLFWVYPLHLVPTEILGQRGYAELVIIHVLILIQHMAVLYLMLWLFVVYLDQKDKYWQLLTMNNLIAIVGFIIIFPLELMVVAGMHSWDDVFGAILVVFCYELAIAGFAIAKALSVPWQLGAAFALLSLFIHDCSSDTIFSLFGV